MDSYASPRVPEKAPDRLDRIADAVYQSLTSALREQCAHRHSLDVTVEPHDRRPADGGMPPLSESG